MKCQRCGAAGTKTDSDSQVDVVDLTVNGVVALGHARLCRRCRLRLKSAWDKAVSPQGVSLA